MESSQIQWMSERMDDWPGHSRFYKIICFLSFRRKRKFTYRDWYIIISIFNGQTREGNQYAMNTMLNIYKSNNNGMPKDLQEL